MSYDQARNYFPQPRTTKPPDDAPTMAEAVTLILLDAHLLLRPDASLQDWSGS